MAGRLEVGLAPRGFSATVLAMTTTLIAKRTRVGGVVETEGDVMVEGRVEGSIRAGGCVTVGISGVAVSDVTAQRAVVLGILIGNVTATERVDVAASARIVGDVKAPLIALAAPGLVEGRCEEMTVLASDDSEAKPTLRLRSAPLVRPARPSGSSPPVAPRAGRSAPQPAIVSTRSTQSLRPGPPPTPSLSGFGGGDEPASDRPADRSVRARFSPAPTQPTEPAPPSVPRPPSRVRLIPRGEP